MSPDLPDIPPWISIRSDQLAAAIDPLGAQLSLLRDVAGRDLLWEGDPAVWAGRAPLLFPVVGSLAGGRYRLGSTHYALGRHGFARNRLFRLESAHASTATFVLSADESSLAVYPFRFELRVLYALEGPCLTVSMQVRNEDVRDMPASLGFHPGFRWPLPYGHPRGAHFLQFECDEPAPVRRIDAHGLLRPESFATPIVDGRLPLDDALFRDDVLILDAVRSTTVSYGADRGPRIVIGFADARYLGLWTKPGAAFLCIEPWQGITDPAGFGGELVDKPGVLLLAPGSSRSLSMSITLR